MLRRTFIPLLLLGGIMLVPAADKKQAGSLQNLTVVFAKKALQGYNLRLWLSNQMTMGLQAWDAQSGAEIPAVPQLGCEYPLGGSSEHLFGSGPMIGGIVNGVRKVTHGFNGYDGTKQLLPEISHPLREHFWQTHTGSEGYNPIGYSGYYYLHSMTVNRTGYDDDGDGKVDEDELDGLDNDGDWNPAMDDIGADGLPDSVEVSCNGQPYDPVTNPDPAGDDYDPLTQDRCHPRSDGTYPFKNDKDAYTEKNGIPDHGEPHVDEDYGAVSDNDLYSTATDTFHTPVIPGHTGMGVKVTQKTYAWANGPDAVIPMEFQFINVGSNVINNAFVALYADMDVGPANLPNFLIHNYAAFDPATRTAYVDNPVDTGATPLGFTLLSTSLPLDSLSWVFQWWDFANVIGPGNVDSVVYGWMSGSALGGDPIAGNQPQNKLSDTRVMVSIGGRPDDPAPSPFKQLRPGDTLRTAWAWVSGMSVGDMLNNARRARRIYQAGGFVMPMISMADSGGGRPITISWSQVAQSPFGPVTSYRVYHGTSSGAYTDSVTTTERQYQFSGLPGVQTHYFAAAAIDNQGHVGALSDEINNAPMVPRGLALLGGQVSISLSWDANIDPDLAGYNIYRFSTLDSTPVKTNTVLVPSASFIDTDIRGNIWYTYAVTGVDLDGHESPKSLTSTGHVIPPGTPQRFLVAPLKDRFHVQWMPNTDPDLAGYNLYRSTGGGSAYEKLNGQLLGTTDVFDSLVTSGTVYWYYAEAVDTTGAVSAPTPAIQVQTGTYNQGILVVCDDARRIDSVAAFIAPMLRHYAYTVLPFNYYSSLWSPQGITTLSAYSTVLYLHEGTSYSPFPLPLRAYSPLLKEYVLGGGKLAVMGNGLTTQSFPYWYQGLNDVFGISPFSLLSDTANFAGAASTGAFPNLERNTVAVPGLLNRIERFPDIPPSQVIYRYRSSPLDSLFEGGAVGLKAADSALQAFYLSFPVTALDSSSASAVLHAVLGSFGEPEGVLPMKRPLPAEYRLYEAYPNPFNPQTSIDFDVPEAGNVVLAIYDLLGREVAQLVHERLSPGSYHAVWRAQQGASGVYFSRLAVHGDKKEFSQTKKLLLMK